jgi:hypothetical protein
MRKSLFTIGLLAAVVTVQAQLHIDDAAIAYVSEGTLLYNNGQLRTRGSGMLDIHGNVMGVGTTTAGSLLTVELDGTTARTVGGNVVLRLNNPNDYANSTYGQLYLDGGIATVGVVSKEYRTAKHGNGNYFQQIALPFAFKAISTLSTELGKTFSPNRWTQNEILYWNNANTVSNHFTTLSSGTANGGQNTNINIVPNSVSGYYMLGVSNNNLDLSTPPATMPTIAPTPTGSVYTLTGRPYVAAPANYVVNLQNAGSAVSFGTNGNNTNEYGETYYSYLQDQFSNTTGIFQGDYGRNIYQFGNPFFTNIDLSRIGYTESGAGDGNAVSNIWGVKYTAGTVVTYPNSSGTGATTYTTGAQTRTFTAAGVPIGDEGLIIKPMQTFVLKLRDNTPQTLNFATLRRFAGTVRADGTDYDVTAAKGGAAKTYTGGVKQLGIIALNAAGKEIGRTYYVVSPDMTTGHQTASTTTVQAGASGGDVIGTFEESPMGGYDNNNMNYWLYINEANEVNFLGKNVKLVNYNTTAATSYKFEIKENAEPITNGAHALSSGIGFYYKAPNGTVQQAKQGETIPVTAAVYDIYYGTPSNVVLATDEKANASVKTLVLFNPAIDNYIVRFDPNWKKADIEVYDMSGKLVISKKAVSTSSDYVLELDSKLKNSYIVKVVSDKGEIVNTKILK